MSVPIIAADAAVRPGGVARVEGPGHQPPGPSTPYTVIAAGGPVDWDHAEDRLLPKVGPTAFLLWRRLHRLAGGRPVLLGELARALCVHPSKAESALRRCERYRLVTDTGDGRLFVWGDPR